MDTLGPYILGPNDTPENGIYTGDALGICHIPPNSVDAFIFDPPYCAGAISEAQRTKITGQGLRSENVRRFGWFVGDNMGTAGLAYLMRQVALIASNVTKQTGSILAFCDWRMISTIQPAIESAGLRFQNLIVWDKGSLGMGNGFRCQHEMILHFTLGSPEYHDKGTSNVIRCPRVPKKEREHQTQKPVDLLAALIRVVAPIGGAVVDCFVGSGSTCVAAKREGRKYLAFEIDPDIAEDARKRIKSTPFPLFVSESEQLSLIGG